MDIPDPILIVVNATVHRTPDFFSQRLERVAPKSR